MKELQPRLGAKAPDAPLPEEAARKLGLFRRMMAKAGASGSVTLELNFDRGREASWKVSCDVHGRPDKKPQNLDRDLVERAMGIK